MKLPMAFVCAASALNPGTVLREELCWCGPHRLPVSSIHLVSYSFAKVGLWLILMFSVIGWCPRECLVLFIWTKHNELRGEKKDAVICHIILEFRSPGSRPQWVSVCSWLLWPYHYCTVPWPRKAILTSSVAYKDTNPSVSGPIPWPHLTLATSKGHSS